MASPTALYGYKINNPGALTATLGSGGNLSTGAYTYVVTFVTEFGESAAGTVSNSNVATSGQSMILTAIPTNATNVVISRNIYRTIAGGATFLLLTTLNNNTTTTFTDLVSDINLGAQQPPAASTADSLQIANGYTFFSRPNVKNVQSGVTAHSGGGQGAAVLMFADVNIVNTVAVGGDSVILPLITGANMIGLTIRIRNSGANACNVFPSGTQSINSLGASNPFSLSTSTTGSFIAVSATNWQLF